MKKIKEAMPPRKKISKPTGKKATSIKFAEIDEKYDRAQELKAKKKMKTAGIATALNKAKEGYSNKPRLKRG